MQRVCAGQPVELTREQVTDAVVAGLVGFTH